MAKSPSTEPAEMPNEMQQSETQKAFQRMLDRMELAATAEDDFASPMLTGIVGILDAETEAEMWDADDLAQVGGRNLRDIEQRLLDYTVKYSSDAEVQSVFKDSKGRGMYLLVRSMRFDNGVEIVWNTSAPLLVAKILWLADRHMLPADVVIRGTHLGGDRWVLKLKKMPPRFDSAEEPPF